MPRGAENPSSSPPSTHLSFGHTIYILLESYTLRDIIATKSHLALAFSKTRFCAIFFSFNMLELKKNWSDEDSVARFDYLVKGRRTQEELIVWAATHVETQIGERNSSINDKTCAYLRWSDWVFESWGHGNVSAISNAQRRKLRCIFIGIAELSLLATMGTERDHEGQ